MQRYNITNWLSIDTIWILSLFFLSGFELLGAATPTIHMLIMSLLLPRAKNATTIKCLKMKVRLGALCLPPISLRSGTQNLQHSRYKLEPYDKYSTSLTSLSVMKRKKIVQWFGFFGITRTIRLGSL